MSAAEMLDHALAYASRGWPVLPLHHPVSYGPKKGPGRSECSCRGPECESQGKHPRTQNGLDGASTDTDIIRSWWTRWPEANVGLITGISFDVLDLDGPEALDALDALAPAGDIAPVVGPMVLTGRGIHIYTEATGAGNRAAMAPGVDWRGRSGYVVAPPSVHHLRGDRYEWGDIYGIDEPLRAVPTWLGDVVEKRHQKAVGAPQSLSIPSASNYGLRALESELGRLALAPEGGRNHALNRSAFALGQLIAGGQLDEATAVAQLVLVATRIGLTDDTIESGLSSGMQSPRRPEVDA